jgi:hypothetical protein
MESNENERRREGEKKEEEERYEQSHISKDTKST